MIRAAGRFIGAAAIGMLVVASAFPAGALAASSCLGLSASDCRTVSVATANIARETSFNFALDFSLRTSGAGQGDSSVTAKGTGALALDLHGLQNLLASSTSDFNSLLKGTLHLDLSSQTTASSTFGNQTTTSSGQLDLVLLDGSAYVRTIGANSQLGAWQATPLSNQNTIAALNQSTPALSLLQNPDVLTALGALPSIKGFINIQRSAQSPTLEGQPQVAFVYTLDQQVLFTSSAILPVIKALAASATGSDPASITDNQATQTGQAVAQALNGTTLTITTWIGATDKLYHALILDGNIQVDSSFLGGSSGQTATAAIHLALTFTKVGQPVTVTAPIAPPPNTASTTISALSPDDAMIPETALARFVGIQTGQNGADQASESFPTLGNDNAPIKVTQLSSYSCSFCRDYYDAVFVNLLPAIRAGQIQYTFVPVTTTGEYDPTNETAAAWCALDQGKFWEMQDVLFSWRSRYEDGAADPHRLTLAAIKLGLNMDKFTACVTGTGVGRRIQGGDQYFNTLNLSSTPSILINGSLVDPPPLLNDIYQTINEGTVPAGSNSGGATATPSGS